MPLFDRQTFWLRIRCLTALGAAAVFAPPAAPTAIDLATYSGGWRIYGSSMGDSFDGFVRRCDVNGDGLDDAVISAHEAAGPDNTRVFAGEAYVVFGARKRRAGVTNIDAIRDVTVYGRNAGDNLTWGIACGDVNGDGYDDLVLGAYSADAANGQRDYTGQVHVVFGGASLPTVIDLGVTLYPTIWGFETGSGTGQQVSVGDLNGDGLGDIGISSRRGSGFDGATGEAGRAYVVFGRTSWPAVIDLMTEADVTVYGRRFRDYLGSAVQIHDLDGDGTAELLVAAEGGSGPGAIRAAAGDLYVFSGRSIWPVDIDMAQAAPTTWIYGPDTFDGIVGTNNALRFGDVDADGSPEAIIGIPNGDGPENNKFSGGECRLAEFGRGLPSTIDLRSDSRSTVFGIAQSERFGTGVLLDDVNGDQVDDLWMSSQYGDGPSETRTNSGEVHILYGGPSFPAVVDLALVVADIVVYGQLNEDQISLRDALDLNGDGLLEIGIGTGDALFTRLESLWLITPFDFDGDGITQLEDNCPLVANASQLDSDADDRGDACAADWDGDGLDDGVDCAISDRRSGRPPEVVAVAFMSQTVLSWSRAPLMDTFDVSRGELTPPASMDYGVCQNSRDANLADTSFEDPDQPIPGQVFHYLVRARNAGCGGAGTWGFASSGTERQNDNPAACP